MRFAVGAVEPFGAEGDVPAIDLQSAREPALFPFAQVPHQATPYAAAGRLERHQVVAGVERFEAENLDEGARFFAEVQACLYDSGVVAHQQAVGREPVGKPVECRLRNLSAAVKQQFRGVAAGERVLGDAFVGQRIVVVVDADILWFLHIQVLNISAKISIFA